MLDYELRKQLEEQYLIEMAISRPDAIQACERLSFVFKVHLAKCLLFSKTEWYSHWLKECSNYCRKCDDIRLKPKAKRPDKDFFLEHFLDEIETKEDAKLFLDQAIMSCPEVDREEATDLEAIGFKNLYNSLRNDLAEKLSEEDTFDSYVYSYIISKHIAE